MEIYVLIGQRKGRYEGEYGLEALAVDSDADMEANPVYMPAQLRQFQDDGDFEALAIVKLRCSTSAVMAALYPSPVPVDATVVQSDKGGEPSEGG